MTKEVVSVFPDTKITEVAEILFKNRFHGVPVMEGNKVVGIVTETDFFTKDASNLFLPSYISFLKENKDVDDLSEDKRDSVNRLLNAKAKDIMTTQCVSIFQDMQVQHLLEFFRTTKFTTLPVTDEENNIVGIITLSDILGMLHV